MATFQDDVYVIGYGRFNPPTKGHQFAIFNKIGPLAKKLNGKGVILTTRTHNKQKNPLTVNQKKKYILESVHNYFVLEDEWIESNKQFCVSDVRDIFVALSEIKKAKHVVILLGEDEMKALKPRIELYNHDQYEIEKLEFVHAGSRSDNSEIGSISATKMREAAKNDDFETFEAMCPTLMDEAVKKEMFEDVKQGMK